ncbi:MAG: membrane dipeptidase [Oscillospiraceae bacterium]|nr:membrane dipeptidase [Oscillospiraceae bacterium]
MSAIFDLHCDTLTRNCYPPYEGAENTLNNPAFQLALSKVPAGTRWVQCFAIFIPDKLRGQDAIDFFNRYAASFRRQAEENSALLTACRSAQDLDAALAAGKAAGILTVEGGAVLTGRLEQVQAIFDAGVRMMTLTWNGPNELASGHDTQNGFSSFGREAVAEMERRGVLVDVSHLNDRGFEELLGFARKPFVASHSNARTVCGHLRNLPDAYISEMVRRGGLIGLNYCDAFIDNDCCGSLDNLYRHICHFLELGAEKCLALGSDYDGAGMHEDLDSVEKSLNIHGYLTGHGIAQETADDICFNNAWRFFQKWMG